MKTPALLSIPLAAAFVAAGLASADRAAVVALPSALVTSHDDAGGEADLDGAMHELKSSLKKLSRALTPESQAEALECLTAMQRVALETKGATPPELDAVPEAERDAYRAGFRKEMLALLSELVAMEMLVVDGEYDKAMEHVRGPLYELRERAHDKYQKE